ncbi:helicase-exonuclease AddAB subunit AddA [Pelotomaculum isophthalicicum JI]|uniref:ATP-dependent helicase/nuclease subunit A n=1 Tax=Pelotomaculum isophthalicicum JI TaxID=947010 RepID=A0A9X4JWP0_9FIRM|nr:helicase-exonuclease AddAB subunit AddA [Pelotomaculum isophthalicicum]MDF9409568.1 helicase-exonuclease AddAB subunit AddA [Pelotomaculum isophthalicicum JI]
MNDSGPQEQSEGRERHLTDAKVERTSKKEWTAEQLEAVNSRTGNLLVAAAAGAGKTAVLVERIIRRITDLTAQADVDRLLVLTFTNAAAAEMRERIGRALAAKIDEYPGSKHLSRQMSLINHACIGTIHSFCLDVIRQHFYRIDLDPAFRVADETEAALIQVEVLEELFERRYSAGDNLPFNTLVDCYGGKRDDADLQELVLEIYRFARSTPQPAEWLEKLAAGFDVPEDIAFDQLPWSASLKKAIALELAGIVSALDLAVRLAGKAGGPHAYIDTLESDRDAALSLARACSADVSWAGLYSLINTISFGRLKGVRDPGVDDGLKKQVTALRDNVKKQIKNLKDDYFSRLPEEYCADLRAVAPLIAELTDLARDFDEAYRKAKTINGLVDFNDLEHYCLQILSTAGPDGPAPSEVALELRQRFVEVLVDEYQDTNAVQEAILQLVSRQGEANPNLFMVGDVKQSIYRFRLADPGLFLDKYSNYPSQPGGPEHRIDLARNFRSRRGVVDAVNFVFRQLMSPVVSELTYDHRAELVYGADYPVIAADVAAGDEVVELYLIERGKQAEYPEADVIPPEGSGNEKLDDYGDPEADLDAVQMEARLVASRVEEIVGNKPVKGAGMLIYDNDQKKYRPATYRDVVVLLRATTGYANTFLEEFRRKGVPAYAELATGYFEATEVETVLSLLKVIDNPRQDVPLAGVLRSPVVGFNAGELAQVRLCRRQGDFFDAVVSAAALKKGAISERLTGFLENLDRWRTAARQGTLAGLIWTLYRETGYYDFVGGLPGGGQRQANLRALHQRAQQYETTGFRGLFLFLRFIERVRDGGRDLGAARALNEKDNVVRLMSIHKSKGLEFPVVFVAGLGKKFNLKDLNKTMLLHKNLGLGPQLIDVEKRITYPTIAKHAIKQELKMEALAEELRILYVAMTRAREKLILVGSVRNLPVNVRRWCGPVAVEGWALPDGELAGANTCLDWLVPALARHRDGVKIRELALCDEQPPAAVAGDFSRWAVFFEDGGAASGLRKQPESELLNKVRRMEPVDTDSEFVGVVKSRLEWKYPDLGLTGCAAKSSVTDLKRRFDPQIVEDEASFADYRPAIGKRPVFMQGERGLTAAEAGSALHLVMQNLDLADVADFTAIKKQVALMTEMELLTFEQADSVPVEGITSFFESPLGKRVISGKKVFRELPFTLALPVSEIYPGLAGDSSKVVLVQGIIDCLVDEGDGMLLLDYKTDRINKDQLEQVTARYRGQLNLYARAIENIYGRKVKEKYLYLFNLGLGIRCC